MQSLWPFKPFFALLVSLCYGLFAAFLPGEYFRDRVSYYHYAQDSIDIMRQYDGVSVLFNEPLFLLYNYYLTSIFPPEVVPYLSVFFIAFTFMFMMVRHAKNVVLLSLGASALLLVSFSFHQQLVALRQGLATALFLWAVYFFYERKFFLFLVMLLGFIHILFFLIFMILFFERCLSYVVGSIGLRLLLLTIIMFIGSLSMLKVGEFLGVRQATEVHLLNGRAGGGGFVLFSFVFLFLYLRGIMAVYHNPYGYLTLIGLVAYFAFYFTIPISGRLIGSFLPFYFVFLVSDFHNKTFYPSMLFIFINAIIFYDIITNNSLTNEGVLFLDSVLRL